SFFATLQEALATDQYDRLVQRLTADARLYSDGGGKVAAALKPIRGAQKVAKFLFGLYQLSEGAFEAEAVRINGLPALLLYRNGRLETTISVGLEGEQCAWLAFVRNPEKISADFVT
ncbi:MAG: hypothetical protein KDC44_08225, partial [Phaeodactylibacter sp.]|nr:hypothetical protein [Phaeodactylibacter sp.]